MQQVESPYGPGVIAYITGELSRFSRHHKAMMRLMVPIGTRPAWQEGNKFADGRNIVSTEFMKHPEAKWVFFMDDDHTFRGDILMELLKLDLDIVQPLVVTRKPPYFPYAYDRKPVGPGYQSKDWCGLGPPGIIEVDASACGGLLVKRRVFEAIEYPYFKEGQCGEGPGEDFYFSQQARAAGFKCHVATTLRMGHIGIHDVWPEWSPDPNHPEGGEWVTALVLDHGLALRLPEDFGREPLGVPTNAEKREQEFDDDEWQDVE